MFTSAGLVDLQPSHLVPTWRNGRSGLAGISKRLDRFFVNESFLGGLKKTRSWVVNSTLSDHNLICLQIEETTHKPTPPFKFNSSWLTES
jgi:hypothetical protein